MASVHVCLLFGIILYVTSWTLTSCNPHLRKHSVIEQPSRHPGTELVQTPSTRQAWKRLLANYMSKGQIPSSETRTGSGQGGGAITKPKGGKRQLNSLDVVQLLRKQKLIKDAAVARSSGRPSSSSKKGIEHITKDLIKMLNKVIVTPSKKADALPGQHDAGVNTQVDFATISNIMSHIEARKRATKASTTLQPSTNFDPTRLENRLFDNPMVADFRPPGDVQKSLTIDANVPGSTNAVPESRSQDAGMLGDQVQNSMSFQWADPKSLNSNVHRQHLQTSVTSFQMGQSQTPVQSHLQHQSNQHQKQTQIPQPMSNTNSQQHIHNQQHHQQQQTKTSETVSNVKPKQQIVSFSKQQHQVFQPQGIPKNPQFQQFQRHRSGKPIVNVHHSSHHSRHDQWLEQQRNNGNHHQDHRQTEPQLNMDNHKQLQQHHQGQNQQQQSHQAHQQINHDVHQQQHVQNHNQHHQPEQKQQGQIQQQFQQVQIYQQQQQHGENQQQNHGVQPLNVLQIKQQTHPNHAQQPQQSQGRLESQMVSVGHQQQQDNILPLPNNVPEVLMQTHDTHPVDSAKRGKIKLHAEVKNALIGNAMANSMRNHETFSGMQQRFQFAPGDRSHTQHQFSRSHVTSAPSAIPATQPSIDFQPTQNSPNQNQQSSSTFDFANTLPPDQTKGKKGNVKPTKPAVNLQPPRPLASPSLLEFVAEPAVTQPINTELSVNSQNMGNNIQTATSEVHTGHVNSFPHVHSAFEVKSGKPEQGFHQQPQSLGQTTMDAHLSMIQNIALGQSGQSVGAMHSTPPEILQSRTANQGVIPSNNHHAGKRTGLNEAIVQSNSAAASVTSNAQTTLSPVLSPVYLNPDVTSLPVTTGKVKTQNLPVLQQGISASNANTKSSNQVQIAYHAPMGAKTEPNSGMAATTGNGLLHPIHINQPSVSQTGVNQANINQAIFNQPSVNMPPVNQANALNTGSNGLVQQFLDVLQPALPAQSNTQSNSFTTNNQNMRPSTHETISQIRSSGELQPVIANKAVTYTQNQQSSVPSQWVDMNSQWSSSAQQTFNINPSPVTNAEPVTSQVASTGISPNNPDPAQAIFDKMFSTTQHKSSEAITASSGGQMTDTHNIVGPVNEVGTSNTGNIFSTSEQISTFSSPNANYPSQLHNEPAISHEPMSPGHTSSAVHFQSTGHSIPMTEQTNNVHHPQMMESSNSGLGQAVAVVSAAYVESQGYPHSPEQAVSNAQVNGATISNQQPQSGNIMMEPVGTNQFGTTNEGQQTIGHVQTFGEQVSQSQQNLNAHMNQAVTGHELHTMNVQDQFTNSNTGQSVQFAQPNEVGSNIPLENTMASSNTNQQINTHSLESHQNTNNPVVSDQQLGNSLHLNNLEAGSTLINNQPVQTDLMNNIQTASTQTHSNQPVNTELFNNLQTVDTQAHTNQPVDAQQQSSHWSMNNQQMIGEHVNQQQNNEQVINGQQVLNTQSAQMIDGGHRTAGIASMPQQALQSAKDAQVQTGAVSSNVAGSNGEFISQSEKAALSKAKLMAKIKRLLNAGLDPDEILELYRRKAASLRL